MHGLLANSTDAATVTAGNFTTAQGGTIHINANGSYTYDPAQDFNGVDTVNYTLNDPSAGNSTSTLTVSVAAVNDAPVVHAPASIQIAENGAFTFSGGNALSVTDVDGGTGNETAEVSWSHGTITSALAGTITGGDLAITGPVSFINEILQGLEFTPDAGFAGQIGLTVSIDDNGNTGAGGPMTDSKTVAIDVTSVDTGTATLTISDTTSGHAITAPATGDVLQANLGVDPDGGPTGTVTYQWFDNGNATAVGTGQTYTLTAGDVGHKITVQASYTDANGNNDISTSTASGIIVQGDNPPVINSAAETGNVVEDFSFSVPLGQLVTDGGFEINSLTPSWTVVLGQSGDTATTTGGGHSGDDAGFLTATVNSGDVIKLSQVLNTVAGISYTVTFWFQASPAGGSFSSLRASWDGTSEVFLQNMATAGNWVEETFNVIGTGSDTLQFNMQDHATFISLDDVSVQANFTPGTETTSGQITFTDADVGDTHTISVAPNSNAGTFTATLGTESSNGSTGTVNWSFSATDAQLTALVGAQQSTPQTYTVTINDGHGGVASQAVTIDLTNPDHAAVIISGPETGSVIENFSNAVTTNQLILNGGFESNTNSWTVTKNSGLGDVQEFQSFPAQAGKQSLNVWTGTDNPGDVVTLKQSVAGTVAGEAYTLTFFVSNQDDFDPANFIHVLWNNQAVLSLNAIPLSGFGVYTEYSATVNGNGATSTLEFDFQNAGGNYTFDSVSLVAVAPKGTETTSGIISFTDADASDTHTVSVAPIAGAAGYIGTMTATLAADTNGAGPGDVNWVYSVSDAAAASLAPGQSLTQTYVVTIDDGHGSVTYHRDVTVTIHGPAPASLSRGVAGSGDRQRQRFQQYRQHHQRDPADDHGERTEKHGDDGWRRHRNHRHQQRQLPLSATISSSRAT